MIVKILFDRKYQKIKIPEGSPIRELKELISNTFEILPSRQKLICKGKVLSDGDTVTSNMKSVAVFEIQDVVDINKRKPCPNDCDFYGTYLTDWYCSTCYTEIKRAKRVQLEREQETSKPPELPEPVTLQTNKDQCWTCGKWIGLLGFKCKCHYFFCTNHRSPEHHTCSFDWNDWGKEDLRNRSYIPGPKKFN